jgi:surface antigen
MFRAILLSAPLALASLTVSLPAPVQAAQAKSVTGEDCQAQRQERRRRGRGIGGMLGGIAGGLGGRIGGVAGVVTSMLPVGELLGEAIAGMLDCDEQQKAAGATQQVVEQAERGGVGTTASWESTTRPGVRGSSTVTEVAANTPQGNCMTVTDIVIVDGEETRAPKRMCRRPPSTRYVRV